LKVFFLDLSVNAAGLKVAVWISFVYLQEFLNLNNYEFSLRKKFVDVHEKVK